MRRDTYIIFSVPATFTPARTEILKNGKVVGFGEGGRMSIDGLESVVIARRGHVDPAKMRELALKRGATESEFTVKHYVIESLRSRQVAQFIVNAAGPAKPIKVNFE